MRCERSHTAELLSADMLAVRFEEDIMLSRLRSAISSFSREREASIIGKRLDTILGTRSDPEEVERRASVQRRLHTEVMSALTERRSGVDRRNPRPA